MIAMSHTVYQLFFTFKILGHNDQGDLFRNFSSVADKVTSEASVIL